MSAAGTLFGLGVGPGDPELLTLKALRILRAAPVIAYPQPDGAPSLARAIVAGHLPGGQEEIAMTVPMRVERRPAASAYDAAAARIASRLAAGLDVAVLCEGDPFLYGSFLYLFERLSPSFAAEIVPGIASVTAAAAALQRPLARRNEVFAVLPAPLASDVLAARILAADGFALIKIGRHFSRVKGVLAGLGLLSRCTYLERVSLAGERILPLAAMEGEAPYFSMILGGGPAEAAPAEPAAQARAPERRAPA